MSFPSIALCLNVYNDAIALRGMLETSVRCFDNVFAVHSGPNGAYSTDGTIELLESFGATIVYDDIAKGFGAIRTRAIHECGCEWGMILDADERFFETVPMYDVEDTHTRYPNLAEPGVKAWKVSPVYNQAELLKHLLRDNPQANAVLTERRHWMDFTMTRPSQSWKTFPDPQLRIVRNRAEIMYTPNVVMHERLIDIRTNEEPTWVKANREGLYHDHFHPCFRKILPGYKEAREANYLRLERGEPLQIV